VLREMSHRVSKGINWIAAMAARYADTRQNIVAIRICSMIISLTSRICLFQWPRRA
jgi:hypothetical protein